MIKKYFNNSYDFLIPECSGNHPLVWSQINHLKKTKRWQWHAVALEYILQALMIMKIVITVMALYASDKKHPETHLKQGSL